MQVIARPAPPPLPPIPPTLPPPPSPPLPPPPPDWRTNAPELEPAIADVIQSVLTPAVEVAADTTPPEIFLNGLSTQTVRIGSAWSDPGAYALDDSATTITSTGSEALQAALAAIELSDLGITASDGSHGPWLLTYTGTCLDHPISVFVQTTGILWQFAALNATVLTGGHLHIPC